MNINTLIEHMTLKEKISQTIVIKATELFYGDDYKAMEEFANNTSYGGVFAGEEIIGGNFATGEAIVKAIKNYKKFEKIPLLICADTEYGCGYMWPDKTYSEFPWQMALGAANDEKLAYDYGKYTAIAAREMGFNLSLAPVADINMNFLNPVVNTRSAGDKPELVANMIGAVAKGMQDYGLGATAKHFPGDGVDYRDQHFVLTTNTLSAEEWKKSFGMVYKRLIDDGLMCIMAGHISFPAYQKERIDEVAPPATLSKELITDLLKVEMGFDGVVISDALCMNAFRTTYGSQIKSELECFKAGVDIMLWPSNEFASALEKAIILGEIPESRLDDAVSRILRMKEKLGLIGESKTFKTDKIDKIFTLDDRISEKAVTLVRDRKKVLPLKDLKRIAIIAITNYDDEEDAIKNCMIPEFKKRGTKVFFYRDIVPDGNWENDLDLIIYVTFCRQHKPQGPLVILPKWQTASHLRNKVIAVAMGSPYLINTNFPTANMAIAAYSLTEGAQKAVVKAIFGEIPFSGTLPVDLPSI